ncbi:cleavage polyadenylation factor subunit fip1, partial [Irineochytrium annulatum]
MPPYNPADDDEDDLYGGAGGAAGDSRDPNDPPSREEGQYEPGANEEGEEADEEDDDDDLEIVLDMNQEQAPSKPLTIKPNAAAASGDAAADASAGDATAAAGAATGAAGASTKDKTSSGTLDLNAVGTFDGKEIFDVDLDAFEDKPWRKPGADLTDYFNFGFSEASWRAYNVKQKQMREEMGQMMQRQLAMQKQAGMNKQRGEDVGVGAGAGARAARIPSFSAAPSIAQSYCLSYLPRFLHTNSLLSLQKYEYAQDPYTVQMMMDMSMGLPPGTGPPNAGKYQRLQQQHQQQVAQR